MKVNYGVVYRVFRKPIDSFPLAGRMIVLLNQWITALFYICYPVFLIILFWYAPMFIWKALLVPAAGFSLISIIRKMAGRQRPYEKWKFLPLIPKESTGNSFPSRHVFSAMMVALTVYQIFPQIGIVLVVLALVEACLRVIGGVHYVSDVLAGMLFAFVFSLFL